MRLLVGALLAVGGVVSQHGPWYVRTIGFLSIFAGGGLLSDKFERRRA